MNELTIRFLCSNLIKDEILANFFWIFLSLRKRWNLSRFTFIQLFRNQKVRLSAKLLISLITSNSELPIANGVLSSAQLTKSMFGINRKKSQRKTLRSSGPNMEPCGTPCSVSVVYLFLSFVSYDSKSLLSIL